MDPARARYLVGCCAYWITAVFQDFVRFETHPLFATASPPTGAPVEDFLVHRALHGRGRRGASRVLDALARRIPPWTAPILSKIGESALHWRARSAPSRLGSGLVLLDEPTAQLDVRGEAEIFDCLLDSNTRPDDDHPHLAPVLHGASRRSHSPCWGERPRLSSLAPTLS